MDILKGLTTVAVGAVVIKGVKIYGDVREAKGVLEGMSVTLQTVENRKENKNVRQNYINSSKDSK